MKPCVSILLEGVHETKESLFGDTVLEPHTGAVTLVRMAGKNILVDTGGRGTFSLIESRLCVFGLTALDIDMVILTHFHLDHAFNVALFPRARVLGWKHFWEELRTVRMGLLDMYEVEKGVFVFSTPGHAEEHLAVLVEMSGEKKIVIAGDAISESFVERSEISSFFYDERLYRLSAQKIMKLADEIIPGHGKIIRLS